MRVYFGIPDEDEKNIDTYVYGDLTSTTDKLGIRPTEIFNACKKGYALMLKGKYNKPFYGYLDYKDLSEEEYIKWVKEHK